MRCISGWQILLIMILLSVFNSLTAGSQLVELVILIGGIVFYLNQRDITGCEYPNYNM